MNKKTKALKEMEKVIANHIHEREVLLEGFVRAAMADLKCGVGGLQLVEQQTPSHIVWYIEKRPRRRGVRK